MDAAWPPARRALIALASDRPPTRSAMASTWPAGKLERARRDVLGGVVDAAHSSRGEHLLVHGLATDSNDLDFALSR